jgi:tetratricopeptide (TPR) repeat protein
MLDRCGDTPDAPTADAVVSLAVLPPDTVPDIKRVVSLAQRAFDSNPDDVGYLESLGAALYRAGKYQDAKRYLDRAVRRYGNGGRVRTQLLLALVHQRLDDAAKAKTWLARAVKQLEATKSPLWEQRVLCRQLHQEAQELLRAARP